MVELIMTYNTLKIEVSDFSLIDFLQEKNDIKSLEISRKMSFFDSKNGNNFSKAGKILINGLTMVSIGVVSSGIYDWMKETKQQTVVINNINITNKDVYEIKVIIEDCTKEHNNHGK